MTITFCGRSFFELILLRSCRKGEYNSNTDVPEWMKVWMGGYMQVWRRAEKEVRRAKQRYEENNWEMTRYKEEIWRWDKAERWRKEAIQNEREDDRRRYEVLFKGTTEGKRRIELLKLMKLLTWSLGSGAPHLTGRAQSQAKREG